MTIKNILKALILSVFLISAINIGLLTDLQTKTNTKPVLNQTVQIDNSVSENIVTSEIATNEIAKNDATEPVAKKVATQATEQVTKPSVTPVKQSTGTPTRLVIPNASVDAHIQSVGVTETGNLDVPPNYTDVGWYKFGPRPGEKGSVVLDGHVDDGASLDGVFKHLRNLKEGDDIYVVMENGDTFHYEVKKSGVYPTTEFPGQMVFHENDAKYLKIITCHGTYIPSLKTYDQRLIVTAVLVE